MELVPNLFATAIAVGSTAHSGFLTRTLDSDSYLLYHSSPSDDIDLLDLDVSRALASNREDSSLPRTGKAGYLSSTTEAPTKLMRIGDGSWTLTRNVGDPTLDALGRRKNYKKKTRKALKKKEARPRNGQAASNVLWKGEPEAQRLRMAQNVSRGTRFRIPVNHVEDDVEATSLRWANLNYLSGAPMDQQSSASSSVSFVPVFPDRPSPYYKSVEDNNHRQGNDYDNQSLEDVLMLDVDKEEAGTDRRGRRPHRRPKVNVQVHSPPTYGAPPPAYAPPAPVYSAPPAQPTVIVYKQPAPVYKHYKTGLDVTPALLGLLPIFLLGGLALGYLYPFNITTSSTSSSGTSGSDINLLNVIEISGTNISNIFVPNNTATQTNSDANTDNIVIADNNNNNNNTGRSWGLLDSDAANEESYLAFCLDTLLELLGTSWPDLMGDLLDSVVSASPSVVFGEMSSLSRKMSCLESANATGDCGDRVICNHLAADYEAYDGNVLVRAGEVFAVTLGRWVRGGSVGEVAALVRMAEEDDCAEEEEEVTCKVNECEMIE